MVVTTSRFNRSGVIIVDKLHVYGYSLILMGRPKTGRAPALNFIPTSAQLRAIAALTKERRINDPRVTQSDVIRDVVQHGLEAIRAIPGVS
jgi:hypothetical protein